MKFKLSLLGLVALALITPILFPVSVVFGQAPVRYVLHEIPLENPSNELAANAMNELGLAVSYHYPNGVKTGYIYDHYGLLGVPGTTHSLTEWVSVPQGWSSSCVGLNDIGHVVGLFETTTSTGVERVGYLLDLDIFSAMPTPSWQLLPSVPGAMSSYGRRINNNGLILIESQDIYGQYLYESNNPSGVLTPLVDPDTNEVITGMRFNDINDVGQLAGGGRLTPGVELLRLPGAYSINQFGDLSANLSATRDKRGRIVLPARAARYSDGTGLEELSLLESYAADINDSGDICGYNNGKQNIAVFSDNYGWVYLNDVVDGSTTDIDFWISSPTKAVKFIANRNASGFGNVYAVATRKTTTGSGKNATTTTVIKHFLLEAQSP